MAVFKALSRRINVNQYCLICNKCINQNGNFFELFYVDDVICTKCRSELKRYPKIIQLGNLEVESLYLYKGLMRELLIQYKEYYDEALFPLFLYKDFQYINKKYKGYTIVFMPSSEATLAKRGFNSLNEIYSFLTLEKIDCLYKSEDLDSKTLPLKERNKIAQVIKLKPCDLSKKKILLVDDIITSGATLKSAYDLLKNECKSIKALTLCYNGRFSAKIDTFFINLYQ